MDYQQFAVEKVAEAFSTHGGTITPGELYVVWFAKTLQNWKALVSTDTLHGIYWEVTHNGDKHETYVDEYYKKTNTVVPDAV